MNSAVGMGAATSDVVSLAATPALSLFRLYTLRISYLVLAVGLGKSIWPVIHHTSELASTDGVRFALLGGLGATAVLGIRYPVQMVPLLLFELVWKAIYLVAFAMPLWSARNVNAAVAEDIKPALWWLFSFHLSPGAMCSSIMR